VNLKYDICHVMGRRKRSGNRFIVNRLLLAQYGFEGV
jgi:hypothetical protein